MLVRELHKHQHRGDPRRRLQPHPRGEPLRPDDQLQGAGQQHLLHAHARSREFYNDFTGCGNTLNCNHPVVRKFILDCLRYWVTEMHVDGFRFDLAAVFAIDVDQQEKGKTPIIHEIETDPVLSRIKLIAEPWSIRQYRLGSFSDRRWAEWNGKFRDTVRKLVKGDAGRRRRPRQPGRRLVRPVRPDARVGAVAVSTASTSSPATTASRSTTSSRTTTSTTSATARRTATAPTTTRAGTAATRGSSSSPTCPTSRSTRSRPSAASRSRTS